VGTRLAQSHDATVRVKKESKCSRHNTALCELQVLGIDCSIDILCGVVPDPTNTRLDQDHIHYVLVIGALRLALSRWRILVARYAYAHAFARSGNVNKRWHLFSTYRECSVNPCGAREITLTLPYHTLASFGLHRDRLNRSDARQQQLESTRIVSRV